MELRSFIRGIAILSFLTLALFLVTVLREAYVSAVRDRESTFVALVANESLEAKDISKVQVALPEGEIRWDYKRTDGLWRLPDFAGAFALNGEVDNVVKGLLQSRMRPVGKIPEDEARYGLLPNSVLTLTLFQNDKTIVRTRIGALVPGAAKDERYVLRDDDDTIYLLNTNPATVFLDAEPPALLDKHILPRALPHGLPERISYTGSKVAEVRQIVIKELPRDPEKMREDPKQERQKKDKKREPTHEFIGTLTTGTTKMYDDGDGMLYVNQTLDIEFDKIVGSISPVQIEYRKFDDPIIEVTFHYKDGKSIALAVSGSLIEGKYPILNKETGQMFIIASEKVDALLPKLKAKEAT